MRDVPGQRLHRQRPGHGIIPKDITCPVSGGNPRVAMWVGTWGDTTSINDGTAWQARITRPSWNYFEYVMRAGRNRPQLASNSALVYHARQQLILSRYLGPHHSKHRAADSQCRTFITLSTRLYGPEGEATASSAGRLGEPAPGTARAKGIPTMKVLIAGGAGYIGSTIASACSGCGHQPGDPWTAW